MIIPFSSIHKVSANAYTVFYETFEKTIFKGRESVSRERTDLSNHPVSIAPVDAATDTPRRAIPPITASPLSIATSYRSHVSCSIETSWRTLRAGAGANPCLLRRAESSSINSSLDEESFGSFSSAGASTLASLPITTPSPASLFSLPTFSASSSNTDSEALSLISSFTSSTSSITPSSDAGEDSNGATTPTATVNPSTSSELSSTDLISSSSFPTSLLPDETLSPTSTIIESFSVPSAITSFSAPPQSPTSASFSPASPSPTTLPSSLLPDETLFPTSTILGSDSATATPSFSLASPSPTTLSFSTASPSPTTLSFSPTSPSPTTLSSSERSESDSGELSTSSTDDSSTTSMETTSFTSSLTSTIDSTATITTSNSTISETQSLTSSETTSVSDSVSLTTTTSPSSSFSDPATNSTSFAITSSDTGTTETSDLSSTSPISTETLTSWTFSGAEPSSAINPATRTTHHMGATVITSLTITTHAKTSSALETITTTYVTSSSGAAPMTITTVLVGPSGTLNNGNAERRVLSSGAIAGISLVSFLGVFAVLLWVLFALRRRHRRHMHQNVHYAVGKRGVSPDGGVWPHSFGPSAILGGAYGTGRDQSNDSGFPIRTSPLQGEDEEYEGQQNSSSHSGAVGGPGSWEGGMVQSYVPDQGFATISSLSGRRGLLIADGCTTDGLRGGDADFANRAATSENLDKGRNNQSLLDAAGLGSMPSTPSFPRSQDPFSDTAGRASLVLGPTQRARSISPPEPSSTRTSLLPTRRTGPFDEDIGSQRDSHRITEIKRNSSNVFQRRILPPSSWPVIDNSNNKGRGHDSQSPSPTTINEPNTDTFGRTRSRSSFELSSSGHGHAQGKIGFTSSQGHGSATASGENEATSGSGSGSSGSHHGSTWSQKRRKRGSNSEDGGFFARAASLARTSIIAQPRRASAAGLDFSKEDAGRLVRPPSPVSHLVPSIPSVSSPSPAIISVIPPSPPPTRVPSGLLRSQNPGTIRPPPMAPSAMSRASGTSIGLPVIIATPPLLTPNHVPDGRLDPRLAARLREIRNVQSSMSTIGLRDHEDYSRPILPLVNNRDSLTSASSEYSQASRFDGDDERTPTQPTMVV